MRQKIGMCVVCTHAAWQGERFSLHFCPAGVWEYYSFATMVGGGGNSGWGENTTTKLLYIVDVCMVFQS